MIPDAERIEHVLNAIRRILPNLEAKFVCANTLVALPEVGRLDAGIGDIADLRRALQENRHKIFGARSTAAKEKYKARDLAIRDAIRKEVRSWSQSSEMKKRSFEICVAMGWMSTP